MSPDQLALACVRVLNAILWIELGLDLWRHASTPLPEISRRLIVVVLVAGMCILAFGAFASIIEPGIGRVLYTVYTGFAAMVAFAVRRTWRA